MKVFDAVVQGIVQGITEFLPVSSSGHLLLSQHILGVKDSNLFFNVMLHVGTLLAVLTVYYKLVIRLIIAFFSLMSDIFSGRYKGRRLEGDKRLVVMLIVGLLPLFLLFLPVPGTGENIKGIAEKLSSDSYIIVVGISLLVTSLLLYIGISQTKKTIFIRQVGRYKNKSGTSGKKSFNIVDAVCVGLTQCVAAIFPGLSRSGSTLSVGLLRGIDRQSALDYSFVLGIPSIMAAAALELKDALSSSSGVTIDVFPVICGVIVSAVVGLASIVLFRWMLSENKMGVFVVYTFVVGVLAVIIGLYEMHIGVNVFTGVPL